MSAEEQKPVVIPEAAPVESTPAPVVPAPVEADKPLLAEEPVKAEEPAKTEGEAVAAPAEEKKEEKVEEKPVEPIYSGALGYKAPGLKNAFRFSKKYFWFGEEAVPTSSLGQYLRGEKAEVSHPVAAWSSQTGKGLLYFVKHADQKESPAGVLNLADATDLSKDGMLNFHFKLHGSKHTFEAQTVPERNGWFVAVEKAVEEAKAAKEGIVSSEGYKEQLEKLGKPAALAAPVSKEGSTPKKSVDATPKPTEEAAATGEAAAPARTGSSSSSSSDEDKKKKKSKSRSVSRGKRASIFGGFLGKKEKLEEKKEEKKEEKEEKKAEDEAKKEETPVPALGSNEAPSATAQAPVITEDTPLPTEETKAEETAAPVAAEEEKKTEEKPKPTKRGSIFGNFVEKLKSPTHEKKEHEVGPAAPKETEVSAEAPKIEEPTAVAPLDPVAPTTEASTEAPKTEEAKETKAAATTPHKEKQHFSFGKFLGGGKEKVKSPTTEKAPEAPKVEEPAKTEETPVVAPVEPIAEAPKEEAKEEKKEEEAATGVTSTATATPPTQKKRGSIFGNLTGSVKKEKEGEEKPRGLGGLFRNASKAGKAKKEKEPTTTPAKVEEATEPKEEATEAPAVEEKKEEAPVAPAETNAIGDVVPDAVTVGQAPKSTPAVATSA